MNRGEISVHERYWPACRVHGSRVRRVVGDLDYCDSHGWHPRDADWDRPAKDPR